MSALSRAECTRGSDAVSGAVHARFYVARCLVAALAAVAGASCSDAISPARAPVAAVTLLPASAVLGVGSQLPLTVTLLDANEKILTGRSIFWGSRDTMIAVVSSAGVVTARTAGTTQIAASAEGQDAIAVIIVARSTVAMVVVAPNLAQAMVGDTVKFTAQTLDASGGTLTGRLVIWASSNQAVAGIDATSGRAIARAPGTTTISATSEGKQGTALLTVKKQKKMH